MFNISRGTLREALRVLEQKGLIEIKLGVGGGSIVKSVDTKQISESLGLLIRSQKVSLSHVAQFREDMEGIIAARAAQRHRKKDIKRLKQLLSQALDCVARGRSQHTVFIDIDKQIHLKMAEITENPIYISVLYSIHDNIQQYYDRFLSIEEPELEENYQDLCDIIEAIENYQAERACELARQHVKRFNRYMKKAADASAPG
jgi:DNA-binding FadR family transcriptional regulator